VPVDGKLVNHHISPFRRVLEVSVLRREFRSTAICRAGFVARDLPKVPACNYRTRPARRGTELRTACGVTHGQVVRPLMTSATKSESIVARGRKRPAIYEGSGYLKIFQTGNTESVVCVVIVIDSLNERAQAGDRLARR